MPELIWRVPFKGSAAKTEELKMPSVDAPGRCGGVNVRVRDGCSPTWRMLSLLIIFLSHFILRPREICVMMIFEEIHITM